MKDTAKRLLSKCISREGITVSDHLNTQYKVIFRRNKDKNSTSDHLTIFAPIDANIGQGETLLLDDGSTLIVLNAETEGGQQYKRIDAVKANAVVSLCYVGEMENDRHDIITSDIPYAENVPIYIISGLTPWRLIDMGGNDLQFLMPARYGFTTENTVKMNILAEKNNHTFKVVEGIFQPNSIDYSLMVVEADGSISGLLTVRGSADLRPRE